MAVAAAAVATVLVLAAVVVHVRVGHRASLLQSSAGLERHMQVITSFSSLSFSTHQRSEISIRTERDQ